MTTNQSNQDNAPDDDRIDPSLLTKRDYQQLAFNDFCLTIAENPKKYIDDVELMNAIADYENPNEDEQILRLSVAIRLLRLQPKTLINRIIMASLKDNKVGSISNIGGVNLDYDY